MIFVELVKMPSQICRKGSLRYYHLSMYHFALYMSILRHDSDLERTMQELGVNKTDNDVNKLMRQQIIERKVLCVHLWIHSLH